MGMVSKSSVSKSSPSELLTEVVSRKGYGVARLAGGELLCFLTFQRNMKIKKVSQITGWILMFVGIIFLFLFSSLVTGSHDESFARDLLGFPIPNPPEWTTFIPFVGGILMFIFSLFSLHGLVEIVIAGIIFYIAGVFMMLGEGKDDKHN